MPKGTCINNKKRDFFGRETIYPVDDEPLPSDALTAA